MLLPIILDHPRLIFCCTQTLLQRFLEGLNSLNGSVSSIPTLLNSDSYPVSSPASKATLLNLKTQRIYPTTHNSCHCHFIHVLTTSCVLRKKRTIWFAHSMSKELAMGLDKISACTLKETVFSITPMITPLFKHVTFKWYLSGQLKVFAYCLSTQIWWLVEPWQI